MFDQTALRSVAAAISDGIVAENGDTLASESKAAEENASDKNAKTKQNKINETANAFFIPIPEPSNATERDRFERLFQEHVAKVVAEPPAVASLAEYRTFVEAKARCGNDFAELGV